MRYELYSGFIVNQDYSVFDFVSLGKHGEIPKRVTFMPTYWPNVYNLAFGDVTIEGDIDDTSVSDNGDRNKILATVVKVVEIYTERYPDRWIYFIGSTKERTRLYRMAVSLHFEELSAIFDIYAEIQGQEEFIPFTKGLIVSAFLVKRKSIKFAI